MHLWIDCEAIVKLIINQIIDELIRKSLLVHVLATESCISCVDKVIIVESEITAANCGLDMENWVSGGWFLALDSKTLEAGT